MREIEGLQGKRAGAVDSLIVLLNRFVCMHFGSKMMVRVKSPAIAHMQWSCEMRDCPSYRVSVNRTQNR